MSNQKTIDRLGTLGQQLLNSAEPDDAKNKLASLIDFLNKDKIIKDYLDSINTEQLPLANFEKDFQATYKMPTGYEEAIVYVYQLLLAFENKSLKVDLFNLSYGYGKGAQVMSHINGFFISIVIPFIEKISTELKNYNQTTQMTIQQNFAAPVNQVAGHTINNNYTLGELLQAVQKILENDNKIEESQKKSLITKIKDITLNPYISNLATSTIFEFLKNLTGILK